MCEIRLEKRSLARVGDEKWDRNIQVMQMLGYAMSSKDIVAQERDRVTGKVSVEAKIILFYGDIKLLSQHAYSERIEQLRYIIELFF